MRESTANLILRLGVICLIAALLLAGTNVLTRDTIAAGEAQKAANARLELIPGADSFAQMDESPALEEYPKLKSIYAALTGGVADAYIVNLDVTGYGGPINLNIGVGADGSVKGVRIGTNSETAGLGSRITEEKFYGQFSGFEGTLAVDKDGGDVDSISGATRSSKAVTLGVAQAKEIIDKYHASLVEKPAEE